MSQNRLALERLEERDLLSFLPPVTYPAGKGATDVATADFNHDGIPDLVVVNGGANTVGILLGNSDGTFQRAASYAVGASPRSVAVGDFNRDGTLDLAVADAGETSVSVLLGNSDSTFRHAV